MHPTLCQSRVLRFLNRSRKQGITVISSPPAHWPLPRATESLSQRWSLETIRSCSRLSGPANGIEHKQNQLSIAEQIGKQLELEQVYVPKCTYYICLLHIRRSGYSWASNNPKTMSMSDVGIQLDHQGLGNSSNGSLQKPSSCSV